MVTVSREYTRDRIGLVFGLGGGQLIVLGLGALPVFMCLQRGLWTAALAAFGVWLLVAVVVVVPVRGRSVTGWFLAATDCRRPALMARLWPTRCSHAPGSSGIRP